MPYSAIQARIQFPKHNNPIKAFTEASEKEDAGLKDWTFVSILCQKNVKH